MAALVAEANLFALASLQYWGSWGMLQVRLTRLSMCLTCPTLAWWCGWRWPRFCTWAPLLRPAARKWVQGIAGGLWARAQGMTAPPRFARAGQVERH